MADNVDTNWSGKSRGGKRGYQFFISVIRHLGVRCAYVFLALIVVYFIPFAPKATKAIWLYNRKIRGKGIFSALKELYCHYYVFGQTLIDKIAMQAGLSSYYRYQFDNYDRFLDVLNKGTGVVMIGAHVGCWEAGATFFGVYGRKINILMLDAEHQNIKEVLNKNTERKNDFKIIALNEGILDAMIQMKIALNNGEYICFNGDRFMKTDNIAPVEFMGQLALFPLGLFKIASKCNVPVVFYYAMREPHCTYRFIFEEPQMGKRNTPENLQKQYVKSLERIIKTYPRQWFNFYDFWNSDKKV